MTKQELIDRLSSLDDCTITELQAMAIIDILLYDHPDVCDWVESTYGYGDNDPEPVILKAA